MEIEVEEYVRTIKGIAKIKEKIGEVWDRGIAYEVDKNGTVITDASFNEFIYKKDIIKHSKSIIDLIEEGDYVNGEIVIKDNLENLVICPTIISNGLYNTAETYKTKIKNITIESIVTKEQFAQMEYKVKE